MTLQTYQIDNRALGTFRVVATGMDGLKQDITFFRGVPTQVGALASRDPFDDESMSFTLPKVTPFDRFGTGDLWWLSPWTSIDVTWVPDIAQIEDQLVLNALGVDSEQVEWELTQQYGTPSFYQIQAQLHAEIKKAWEERWKFEGYIVSLEPWSGEDDFGTEVSCKGALYQLDDFLAKPQNPVRPIPYEVLIRNAFDPNRRPSLRTKPLRIVYPDNWSATVPNFPKDKNYLQPVGIPAGELWTGLASRSTGSWQPLLTGFVQELLTVMYTRSGGQWTIAKENGRRPVLKVRSHSTRRTPETLYVDLVWPGVTARLGKDFSQSTNVIYGAGTDFAGVSYSNVQPVAGIATTTLYEPFAALSEVHPYGKDNPMYNRRLPRKEIHLTFQEGLDAEDATNVARQHLNRFSDPGWSGTLTLKCDPRQGEMTYPRYAIKAGMRIVLRGWGGDREGVLLHISAVTVDLDNQSVALTVDTKFRDQLTIEEVRARTRDALDIRRALQVNGLQLPFDDYLKPWSYARGSGVIPSGGKDNDATPLFTKKIPQGAQFPWEEWTKKFPPKDYPQYYINVGPKSKEAKDNWSHEINAKLKVAIPVLMAERGSIRSVQLAAYDRNGRVLKVRFHAALYQFQHTVGQMPKITKKVLDKYPNLPYGVTEPYPFFPGAFEGLNEDGTQKDDVGQLTGSPDGLVIGWGNSYQPAGYSPGLKTSGDPKTGLLIDESIWTFDTSSSKNWNLYNTKDNVNSKSVGYLYIMIYCDDQGTTPVYFLGRLFRQEPGAS